MGVKVGVSQNAKYNAATMTLSRHLREETYGKASFGLFHQDRLGAAREYTIRVTTIIPICGSAGFTILDTMRYIMGALPVRMWAHSFNPPWSPYKGGAGVSGWVEFDGGSD